MAMPTLYKTKSHVRLEPWESTYPNSICRLNGYDEDAVTYIPVVIVGAGESGIAMGCRLREVLGFDQFRIFDRQAGVGGTWWINRYPGVACDVPAVFYSFSFSPNHKWTSFHPPGPEIVKYLNDVCSKYQITDKIQLNTGVEGCTWLEDEQVWEVTLEHFVIGAGDLSVKDRMKRIRDHGESSVFLKREVIRAKIVISAVGGLVEPKGRPENVPGMDKFEGPIFHSARWDDSVDFNDKDVVVIGTGCSAAQFVPRLPKTPFNARSVTQIMRSPPWVVPRLEPPGGEKWWSENGPHLMSSVPGLARLLRTAVFIFSEYDMRLFYGDEKAARERKKVEKALLKHLYKTTPEKYHAMLTPDYGVGCKRRIFDATWFPSLKDPKINLTTQPLTEVGATSVTLGPGQTYPAQSSKDANPSREIPADVIVLANGFDTTRWLHPLKVVGRGGKDLVDEMQARGGPQAYQGAIFDGFPNFFIVFGPNTATGHSSVIMASENMVNYTLKLIKPILAGNAATVEVKREAEEKWTAKLQDGLKDTVWMRGGCNSWYFDQNGWNSTVYPWSQIHFWYRCEFPVWNDLIYNYTPTGLRRRRTRRTAEVLFAALALFTIYNARKSGKGLGYLTDLLRSGLDKLSGLVTSVRQGI